MAHSSLSTDWQIGMSRIHQRAGHILQTGQWADCTFVVGNENNQKTLHGHRLILAMSSPVFEAMFFGGMAEKGDKPVEILDVQPEAFKALLQYIYSDDINLSSFDQVCEICYAAKKYMIPALVEQCTQFIWSDLHPGNVCRAFEFARLFEEPRLLEKCLQIICTKTDEVLKDSSFEEVDVGTLRMVLKQENLAASELLLWEACLRWTKQECGRQSLEVTPMNQRKVFGDCLGLIRMARSLEKEKGCEGSSGNHGESTSDCMRRDVLLVGDSNVNHFDVRLLPNYNIQKIVYSGATSEQLLQKLDINNLCDSEPDIVVIIAGGNDIVDGCQPAVIARNLYTLCTRIWAKGKPCLLSEIFTRTKPREISAVNFQKVKSSVSVRLRKYKDPPIPTIRCKGMSQHWVGPDGLYLNELGNKNFAQCLKNFIEDYFRTQEA